MAGETGTHRGKRITIALIALCVISLALISMLILFVTVVLYLVGLWKVALAVPIVVAAGAAVWCWRPREQRWPVLAIPTALAVLAVGMGFVFSSIWRSEAAHDAHLASMVQELCGFEPPAGASLERCSGSITNTGNGNSCRYWARAMIRSASASDPIVEYLGEQGFVETSLDIWNEPMLDGRTYWRSGPDPAAIELSLMESWRPPDDDLRCPQDHGRGPRRLRQHRWTATIGLVGSP